ncbi:MAG: hypothetical protein ACYCOR_07545 [Acidobacteriaceae bacterium]
MIEIALQSLTIIVLLITWRAIARQACAAEKLTKATSLQIKTGQEQAQAAKEQVEVARRQITESLRPILTCKVPPPIQTAGGSVQDVEVQNEGAGTALDIWWAYGKPGDPSTVISQRNHVQNGIIPPHIGRSFRAQESRAVREDLMIVYESLSGITSASTVHWNGNYWVHGYQPDVSEWAKSLLGKVLGPTN